VLPDLLLVAAALANAQGPGGVQGPSGPRVPAGDRARRRVRGLETTAEPFV